MAAAAEDETEFGAFVSGEGEDASAREGIEAAGLEAKAVSGAGGEGSDWGSSGSVEEDAGYAQLEDVDDGDEGWTSMPSEELGSGEAEAAAGGAAAGAGSGGEEGDLDAVFGGLQDMLAAVQADYEATHASGQRAALAAGGGSTSGGLVEEPAPQEDGGSDGEEAADTGAAAAAVPAGEPGPFDPFGPGDAPRSVLQPRGVALPPERAASIAAAMSRMKPLPPRAGVEGLAAALIAAHGATPWAAPPPPSS